MNIFIRRLVISIIFVASMLGIDVSSAEDATLKLKTEGSNASEIISQVVNVYKTCKSYSDSGVVKTVFFTNDDKRIDEKPFTTAFVRPDRFRFEYSSKFPMPGAESMRYIVWANGKDVRTWWDIKPGVKQLPSLGMAIAAATGVSSGSALRIPKLLMPAVIEAWSVTDLQQIDRIDDAVLDGVDCYRVQGKDKSFRITTLWISKKNYLINRVDESNKFTDFRTETTTTYKPNVNNVIDENKLEFNSPEENSSEKIEKLKALNS